MVTPRVSDGALYPALRLDGARVSRWTLSLGEVGSDLKVEYAAMSEAINLASRLNQHTPEWAVATRTVVTAEAGT